MHCVDWCVLFMHYELYIWKRLIHMEDKNSCYNGWHIEGIAICDFTMLIIKYQFQLWRIDFLNFCILKGFFLYFFYHLVCVKKLVVFSYEPFLKFEYLSSALVVVVNQTIVNGFSWIKK